MGISRRGFLATLSVAGLLMGARRTTGHQLPRREALSTEEARHCYEIT